jgi:uncharacterized LabA/DUF88 family protein
MTDRAALYVDGFNLYHAIDDLHQNHLKWLNLWRLGELLIPSQSETLVKVVYCTAIRSDDPKKMIRHRGYIRALEAVGVTCLKGHFSKEERNCRQCSARWQAPVEKQGDVNLAISLVDDAYTSVFDHAYLITADSDQAATVRLVRERFPDKRVTTVSPPGRSHCKEILAYTARKIALSPTHLARSVFPKHVIVEGKLVVTRDPAYDPPAGWLPPGTES